MVKAPFDREIESYQRLLLPKTSAEFKRKLERSSGRRVDLTMTHNHRSLLRSIPLNSGRIAVRAHTIFLYAPPLIVELLGRYVANPLDRVASRGVDFFISGELDRVAEPEHRSKPSHSQFKTRGRIFDLGEIYQRFNSEYFDDMLDADITWGRGRRQARRTHSILFGSFTPGRAEGRGLIRIHPALDQDFVPQEFLEFVVFHEMIHVLIPTRMRDGRRLVHPPEFHDFERKFQHFEFASNWEKRNLHRFIG
jgi:hypothetical protein